jgi:hypothetical protein
MQRVWGKACDDHQMLRFPEIGLPRVTQGY